MFERRFRLPKGTFKSEKVLSSPSFLLKLAKNGKPFSRFAIAVPKKVDKRSTVRNRVKRKFRSCIEKNLSKIVKGYDFLFIIKQNIEEEKHCEAFLSQLKRESLLVR